MRSIPQGRLRWNALCGGLIVSALRRARNIAIPQRRARHQRRASARRQRQVPTCTSARPGDGESFERRTHQNLVRGAQHRRGAGRRDLPNTGHHHLLINVPIPPLDEPIPNDKNHLHFGAGQTEAYIDLTPGTYTLQLLMGDADHVPHDPPVTSKKITIHVR